MLMGEKEGRSASMNKKDMAFSLICIAVSLLFIFWVIPNNVPTSSLSGDIPAAALPTGMMCAVLVAGVAVLLEAVSGKKKVQEDEEESDGDKLNPLRFTVILAVLVGYVLALDNIGFYVSTLCFLTLGLYYYNRPRLSLVKTALISLIFLVCVFLLFEKGLVVYMPRGLLF